MSATCLWANEATMCAAFIEDARRHGWIAYPETAGWDVLLVDPDTGTQVGVEAKLRGGLPVLAQAIDHGRLRAVDDPDMSRPDHILVLLGTRPQNGMDCVATQIGLHVRWAIRGESSSPKREEVAAWPALHHVGRRHGLPAFVPPVPAGVPSPVRATRWRIAAIRLWARMRATGYVTRLDFDELGLRGSIQHFRERSIRTVGTVGRLAIYCAIPGIALPGEEYPEITQAVLAAYPNERAVVPAYWSLADRNEALRIVGEETRCATCDGQGGWREEPLVTDNYLDGTFLARECPDCHGTGSRAAAKEDRCPER